MKIGVIHSSFRLETRASIMKAAEIGLNGIQLYTTKGDLDPQNLSATGREDLKKFVADQGLEISALCGDFGGHGFTDAATLDWRVGRTKEVVDLAVDLGTNVVTTHIGVVPEDRSNEAWAMMLQSLPEIGTYAAERGVFLATETGPEPAALLAELLDELNNPGIRANYDPANLVMVAGDDPVKGVFALAKYIVHTHAKDGIKLEKGYKEVPLGEGGVDFPAYVKALREIGFDGFFTIEREVGDDPVADIVKAKDFLSNLAKELE